MGIQSNDVRNIYTIYDDSIKYLQKSAESDYIKKHFLVKNCFEKDDNYLKYHYMISKYLADDSCSIVDYVNKKLSGELDNEYRKRKILQRIDRVEFTWECNDMYEDASCCDWKAIQW